VVKGGKLKTMDAFFFSGSNDAKLDEKNRFVLPQQMRYGLVEDGKLEFALGIGLGGCLAIYKKSDIAKIVKKFQENIHVAKYQKFFTFFFSTLHYTSCDKIGRITVPARLKTIAGIEKEVVVAGVLNKIEIWSKEKYDQQINAMLENNDSEINLAQMTEDAFALLSDVSEKNEQ